MRVFALALVCLTFGCRGGIDPAPDATAPPESATPVPAASDPAAPPARTASTSTAGVVRYDVVLVSRGDVLNVRAAASPKAPLVHALAPSARGLRGTGREAQVAGTRWVEVATPSGPGWANAGFLVPVVRTSSLALDVGVGSLLAGLAPCCEWPSTTTVLWASVARYQPLWIGNR